jgi:pimeloyl-ACP methyl ester carboxylesterase
MAPASLPVGGIEISYRDEGEGPAVALLHETAATGRVWDALRGALGAEVRVISHDRRGWGETGAPEGYARTTVEEHAEDSTALLAALGVDEALLAGAGIGAVAALDLALRRSDLVQAVVLIEPLLLALLPQATEGMSADREAIEATVREGGPPAALDAYLAGALPFLGPGAERIPAGAADTSRPLSLFAELAAVPAWPLHDRGLLDAEVPSLVVTGASTPPILRSVAGELASRLAGARRVTLGGAGLPHVDAAPELAREIRSLLAG